MKISLLLEREPFGSILAETLTEFLSSHFQQPFKVQWGTQPGGGEQTWLVNSRLNAIFLPGVTRTALEPIISEFGRSVTPWKTPLQRLYVELATRRPFSQPLADFYLDITPAVPDGEQFLIVGGNHKIRILHPAENAVYVICKKGFDRRRLTREVEIRHRAEALGLPVVPVIHASKKAPWFIEEFIIGTPLNRLSKSEDEINGLQQAVSALKILVDETEEIVSEEEYLFQRKNEVLRLIDQNNFLSPVARQKLHAQIEILARRKSSEQTIQTVLSHGDFQPANILLVNPMVILIDWEYAERRIWIYDILVYLLQSRFPKGLADRLHQYVNNDLGLFSELRVFQDFFNLEQTIETKIFYANLFFLEELLLHLKENNNPLFFSVGSSLRQLFSELDHWIHYICNKHQQDI